MAEAIVSASCPVYVHLDPEARTVTRVVIAGEELITEGAAVIAIYGVGEREQEAAELAALELLEDRRVMTPAWEFGR